MSFNFEPIGYIRSPYKEKFAVPRQPNLIQHGYGELHFTQHFTDANLVKGLEQFSHLWLVFVFNQTMDHAWQPTVRPPRLGGNKKVGIFATRSTFRPNPIGLSSVRLNEIITTKERIILKLGDVDIVDNTPVIDIKPYIPYSDSHPDANAGFAQLKPMTLLDVTFSSAALDQLAPALLHYPHLKHFITEVIAQDPRPAYQQNTNTSRDYGIKLYEYNIRFTITKESALVTAINHCHLTAIL